MKTIVAIYTADALVEPLKDLHQEIIPDSRLINIIDDSLIQEVIKEGEVTNGVKRRLLRYFETAIKDIGADVVLNTCSSVSEVVDIACQLYATPIVKIDEPMAKKAVRNADRIGVMATLSTTLNPTIRLLEKQADQVNKKCEIINGLAEGAFTALSEGKNEEHDRLIMETANKLAEKVDTLVLAQGSMARMKEKLVSSTGKPILTSPASGLEYVKKLLDDSLD